MTLVLQYAKIMITSNLSLKTFQESTGIAAGFVQIQIEKKIGRKSTVAFRESEMHVLWHVVNVMENVLPRHQLHLPSWPQLFAKMMSTLHLS